MHREGKELTQGHTANQGRVGTVPLKDTKKTKEPLGGSQEKSKF